MQDCIALRHVAFEDLGILEPLLRERGLAPRYVEAGCRELSDAEAVDADLVVILGGPIGVYEEKAYPFLTREIEAIAERLRSGRPTLGVCLGAQLMARALGVGVAPGQDKEIGWAPVVLSEAGLSSPLRHIGGGPVLHWHGDNFALPEGASNLASTEICPNQAFAIGRNILGLQFHIEADPCRIEQWLIGHTVELSAAGIDPAAIRADTVRHGRRMAETGACVLTEWLNGIER